MVNLVALLTQLFSGLQVEGFIGDEELGASLQGADLVVIPAGVPRKPGMTRDDLFNINAGIVKNLVTTIAKHAPNVRRRREAARLVVASAVTLVMQIDRSISKLLPSY